MPHKHKRRHKDDFTSFDLPPMKVAKPLPAKESNADFKESANKKRRLKKPAQIAFEDDTPKAFLRMMHQFQKSTSGTTTRSQSGLEDDGTKPNKKRKRGEREGATVIANGGGMASKRTGNSKKSNSEPGQHSIATSSQPPAPPQTSTAIPKILPGERLSDFSARVNRALPFSGISRKSGSSSVSKDPALKNLREHRQTKHERRLLRLQREWREEEARIREREEAEREENEAEEEEINEQWKAWEAEAGLTKKKKGTTAKKNKKKIKKRKKSGRGDVLGGAGGSDADNVVQAPPAQLTKPKEKFKVRGMGGAKVNVVNVPSAAGSLRAREELAEERQSIVEEYRRVMAERRG
ncbi:conserved hypothetical protein [Histoplasma capsulatum var. duboisii H88]|uniref:Urease accessory protein UreD n=1 Tax=Ajellomyces capsulatus (strain H88) TaxID=544711 RepID=F0U8G2_AJEC8|nr:conserved hypothetical protein [Histoplasma capsulatum var. duboisii H88]